MTWAQSCLSSAMAPEWPRVTISTAASFSMLMERSLRSWPTLMAKASFARPGPMAAAMSAPVTGPSNSRTLPSGSVMATI